MVTRRCCRIMRRYYRAMEKHIKVQSGGGKGRQRAVKVRLGYYQVAEGY